MKCFENSFVANIKLDLLTVRINDVLHATMVCDNVYAQQNY